jgi:hypothetical protein
VTAGEIDVFLTSCTFASPSQSGDVETSIEAEFTISARRNGDRAVQGGASSIRGNTARRSRIDGPSPEDDVERKTALAVGVDAVVESLLEAPYELEPSGVIPRRHLVERHRHRRRDVLAVVALDPR